MTLKDKIDIAAGRKKAGLVLKNCKIVNVFTLEVIEGDVAIEGDTIVAVGAYEGEKETDIAGQYVTPGFIDGHVHIESSMLTPARFAEAVVPRGTTAVIADPHEIANVRGEDGIRFMIEDSKSAPLDVHVMLPSCVPAVDFEEAGACLDAAAIRRLIRLEGVLGLGEVMCYPDAAAGAAGVIEKIKAAEGRVIDGHAPRLTGKELAAYVISGPSTEHECETIEEMKEKLRLGMYIHIRNGTVSREVKHLVKGITPENTRRTMFCTDDRHPLDLLKDGHIDHALRVAVAHGLDPLQAVAMATHNPATCYGLKRAGAVAPGYRADLAVVDDLKDFRVSRVYKNGKLVAENGKALFETKPADSRGVTRTVHMDPIAEDDLKIRLRSGEARVISPVTDSIVTRNVTRSVTVKDGCFAFDPQKDICKVAVFERHRRTGHIGLGLLEGFGLKDGAIAQTIAHDSHNIIAAGGSDRDIAFAVNELVKGKQGGIVLTRGGAVVKKIELPVAGLLSPLPLREVAEALSDVERAARETLGVNAKYNPLMLLGFLALPVIPEIRVTTRGLFDVTAFQFIEV